MRKNGGVEFAVKTPDRAEERDMRGERARKPDTTNINTTTKINRNEADERNNNKKLSFMLSRAI